MKKTIVLVLSVGLMISPLFASASTVLPAGCSIPPDHAVWNSDNSSVVSCISAANWNAAMSRQQTDPNQKVFKFPSTITDQYGVVYDCASWMGFGCVDPTTSKGYDSYIRGFGSILVSAGYTDTQLPMYAGLMDAVR